MNGKNARWHQMTAEAVCQQLHTDAACGLSRKAARSRFKKFGANTLFDRREGEKDNKNPSFGMLTDAVFLIMLLGVLLALLFMPFFFSLFLLAVFLCCIGILLRISYNNFHMNSLLFQYRIPTATVIRDRQQLCVSARRVVVGDVLVLKAGDIVP